MNQCADHHGIFFNNRSTAGYNTHRTGCRLHSGFSFLALYGERFNKLHGITAGLSLLGLAALFIGTMPLYCSSGNGYILILVFSLIAGVGFIMIDLLMNSVIADIYPNQKNALL